MEETHKAIKSSEGVHDQEYKLKTPSRWVTVALALRAIMNMRVLLRHRLYCCLFPSDFEFEKDTLIQLWMATGFFLEPWEILANNRFDRLLEKEYIFKSRTDFLTGTSKYKINAGKVTTLLNGSKSKHLYTLIDDENTGVDRSTSWHVSVASKSIDETMFETLERFSELRTVILIRDYGFSLRQIPASFFCALQFMQALDLSGSHISELPCTIEYMTQLRFLDLSFTLIERIPEALCLLRELQTLKLKECKHLHHLPKGMKELVNLYHLDFDVLGHLSSMPKGMGSLTKLRTLSGFIVSAEDGCSVRELKDMNNLVGSLCISQLGYATGEDAAEASMEDKMHLTRLHLKWDCCKRYDIEDGHRASSTLQYLRPHPSLVELRISHCPGSDLPAWMQDHGVFWKVVSITLCECGFEKLSDLGSLPNLRHLNLYNMYRVAELDTCSDIHVIRFPKLETLEIDGMPRLKLWTRIDIGDFPCLSKVNVQRCPKLTELPFHAYLDSLTYLEISNCKSLESLPDFHAYLDSLTYLEISHCKSLESLPDGKLPSSLETLMIINCPSLKRRCSKGGEDWEKIKDVPNIWIDFKDIHSADEDTDFSEVEYDSDDSDSDYQTDSP